MSGTSFAVAFSNALTFQIGALSFGPIQTIVFVVALTAALVAGADLWRIGQREDRQSKHERINRAARGRVRRVAGRRRDLGGVVLRGPLDTIQKLLCRLGGHVVAPSVLGFRLLIE